MKRILNRASWQRLQVGVLVVVLATLGILASKATGYPLTKLVLHDTGIWISSDADGSYGRLNKAALGLDGYARPPGQLLAKYELDILQDGPLVAGWDKTGGKLTAINSATVKNEVDNAVDLPPGSLVQMRGGTIAVLDPTGKIWASRYSDSDAVLDVRTLAPSNEPTANLELGSEAPDGFSLAVAVDGTVYAASVSGKLIRIPVAAGVLGKPVTESLTGSFESIQLAAVGQELVAYDAVSGRLQLPGGKTAEVKPDPVGRLQESGPATAGVMVATSTEFDRFTIATGDVNRIDGAGDGAPARPVRLAGCDFSAWAGVGHYVQACEGAALKSDKVDRTGGLVRPVFRINNGLITLNDQATGRAFDFDTHSSLDNWKDVRPQSESEQAQKNNQVSRDDAKPKAVDDDLKARPDRSTVLHVLDNDTDSAGGILMIKSVSGVAEGVQVQVSPDAQTLKVMVPQAVANTSFRYKISNGSAESEASVNVTNAGTQNTAPKFLGEGLAATYTTPAFGNLSIPVIGSWRDAEGDPVAVVSAKDEEGQLVPVTADGRLEFTAGLETKATVKKITYDVTDGIDTTTVQGTVDVNVLANSDTKSVPPVAQPDTAQGEVNKPVTIWPLANDMPGADPRTPQARIVIGADVPPKTDLAIETDAKAGKIVVTGKKAGTYFLEYQAGFGSSALAKGTIRVDLTDAAASSAPVAMPDQAAVHGQGAVMVDVLANDYDPSGGLLTVQAASAADSGQLEVAVIGGRWLRILPRADQFAPNPQVVHYTVSNGAENVTGDVVVTQLPGVPEDQPLVRDDFATVRDADSVLIGVLDNDTSLSGAPLTLATNIQGIDSAGQLKVINPAKAANEDQGDVGKAFVHNGRVRYIAPTSVEASRQVQIEYVAVTASGNTAVGHVTVTINPQPATTEADHAPVPQAVEMRLVSGSRVAIPVPTTGADPDGDTVTVTGITSAPKLGRIVGFSPASVTYEAYPTAGLVGTDSFSYEVTDRYGKKGQAAIRVAVVPPGQTQPPVAIDDAVTARPGAKVQVNVVANDLVGRDDLVTVAPLAGLNTNLPASVSLSGKKGPIVADAPQADAQPLVLLYALKGNGGTGPSASVKIVAKEGYKNPPTVIDQTAVIAGKVATADVLSGAWDTDGDVASLTVDMLASPPGLTHDGGKVTVPLTDRAQVVPFKVTDGDGATNAGVIYIPAAGAGAPVLKPGALIEIGQNQSLTAALADYVVSPRGKAVKIATGTIVATPTEPMAAQVTDADKFGLTAKNDYVGPAAVVVEVMDAASLTDPDMLKATISIPVQVGPKTPVLRCPSDPQVLVQGGEAKELDITTLCHVWAPNPDDLATTSYTATFSKAVEGVTATPAASGGTVVLQAGSNAVGGASGSVTIGVAGSPAKTAEIPVTVQEAPKPTMQSQTINDVKQGSAVTVQIGLTSPLLKPEPTIIAVKQMSGPTATESHAASGSSITFTPDANVSGTIVFSVTASDVSDTTRTNRQVTRDITLVVYGVPDTPQPPQPGNTVQSRAVQLTWAQPKSNGAAIDQYKVTASNGTPWTFQSTEGPATGLTNGVPVTFTVMAHNKAGWSAPSAASGSVTPDEAPGAPSGVTASDPQDGTLKLSWTAPTNNGSALTFIHITWQGGSSDLSGSSTSTTISGLNNDTPYTFTVWGENSYMPGPNATGTGQSSGKPTGLTVSAPVPASAVGASTPVKVNWTAADPNGPGPVTYAVKRSDGKQICTGVTTNSCTDDTVTFDGKSYTYTTTAVNATGEPHSATATSASWKATGTPDPWGSWTAAPTAANGTVHLAYTVPPARGMSSTVTILQNGSAAQTYTASTGGGADTKDITGLTNGQAYKFSFKVCNDNNSCSTSNEQSATPFGPLAAPTITASLSGNVANFTATANGNGASATLTVASTKTGKTWTTSGTGALTIKDGEDIGYSNSTAYTATLATAATTPSRSNPSPATSSTVTTPAPPPLSAPAVNASVNGQAVTVTATGDGNGLPATLTLTSSTGNSWSTSGSGALSIGKVEIPGPRSSVTYKATLVTDPSIPRSNPAPVSKSVSTPTPSVVLTEGGLGESPTCKFPCRQNVIDIHGFTPNASFTVYYSTDCANLSAASFAACGGGTVERYASSTVSTDSNGDGHVAERFFGYWGSNVWVEIDAYGSTWSSSHVQWVQ